MKTILFFTVVLIYPAAVFSQRWFTVDSSIVNIPFQVTEKNNTLFIDKGKLPDQNLLPVVDVRLSDADLKIDIQTKGLKKGFRYDIQLVLTHSNGVSIKPDKNRLAAISADPGGLITYIWMDLTETYLDLNGRYTLVVKKYLQGEIDCQDKRPEFTVKQQWPHYVAAGAGLGLIGIGQLYRLQKEDAYDTYRSYWSEDLKGAEALPYLERAREKEKDMRTYTITGIAVLGADALVFVIRQLAVRQKQQLYDKYCAPKTGLTFEAHPFVDPGSAGSNPAIGSKIIINF